MIVAFPFLKVKNKSEADISYFRSIDAAPIYQALILNYRFQVLVTVDLFTAGSFTSFLIVWRESDFTKTSNILLLT